MDRVDYLRCRISQLCFKGASNAWAQFLTRLELGDRPAGQRGLYTDSALQQQPPLLEQIRQELRARRGGGGV